MSANNIRTFCALVFNPTGHYMAGQSGCIVIISVFTIRQCAEWASALATEKHSPNHTRQWSNESDAMMRAERGRSFFSLSIVELSQEHSVGSSTSSANTVRSSTLRYRNSPCCRLPPPKCWIWGKCCIGGISIRIRNGAPSRKVLQGVVWVGDR